MADSDIDVEIPVNIPEFYKGKSIFLTGFTGSIGKVIAEKLLFSCPDINKIYVLIRGKRGKSAQERAEEAMQSMAFCRLREKYPGKWESKIVAINGDITEDKMGLSEEDENLIRREVSIIMHGAASVRFDDPLDVAVKQNTIGAKKMVDLALTMPNLISFVYISTAYSNCDHVFIKEELYPPKADWRQTIKYCNKLDPATLNTLHKKIIKALPNTYVFTKSLSEHVINEYRDKLPVVIVRPSIVIPAYKEPIPGWTDNKYGPLSLLIGFLFGIIRCSWISLEDKCNYLYSDICVNAIIIVAWKTAFTDKFKDKTQPVTVYNVCEPLENSIDHKEFSKLYLTTGAIEDLIKDKVHFVSLLFIKNELWYRINILYRHVLPALIIDRILVLLKKKPILLTTKIRVFAATSALHHFTCRTFKFDTTRFSKLKHILKPEDVEPFGWKFSKDMMGETFFRGFMLSKKGIIKPLYDDIEKNSKRLQMLYIVDRSAVYLTHGLFLWILYVFSIPQLIISSIISFFIIP